VTLEPKLAERLEAAADAVSDAVSLVGSLADELEAAVLRIEQADASATLGAIAAALAAETEAAQNGLDVALTTMQEAGAALDLAISRNS
jgi:hypothetical protein